MSSDRLGVGEGVRVERGERNRAVLALGGGVRLRSAAGEDAGQGRHDEHHKHGGHRRAPDRRSLHVRTSGMERLAPRREREGPDRYRVAAAAG